MKKIISLFAIMFSIVLFTNCSKNDDTPAISRIDYVGFESDFQIGVDPLGTTSREVKISTSQTSSSDRNFNIAVIDLTTTANPEAYTIPSTVIIPANSNVGAFTVEVFGPNVSSSEGDTLTIEITSGEVGLVKSDPININLKHVCPNPELFIDITFDQYPEEVYWRVLDSNDDKVLESLTSNGDDPWGAYDTDTATPGSNVIEAHCLASGTYTFEMYDKFSDGGGPFTLTVDGIDVYSNDGVYGFTANTMFTIP